ncbi:hypothetical protein Mpsy_2987 [Methanolobus psychrophilus R15]|nr:hypothetical protein Mpsy_2987 [Methanolobus psychrophilus R15]
MIMVNMDGSSLKLYGHGIISKGRLNDFKYTLLETIAVQQSKQGS